MLAGAALASAQTPPAGTNGGAIRITGGLDVPSVYMFRGLLQESEPKITLWPYVDLGVTLASGEGALNSVGVNVGWWNSYHTGSSGTGGPSQLSHYEEDFYTTLNLGFGGGVGVGLTYMALTSPNAMFGTVNELQVKISKAHRLNPYGFLAVELTDVSADAGVGKGSYAEIGVGPSFGFGPKITLTIPVKVGLSLKDYYELNGEDHKFGWFDVGALVTLPLSTSASKFGSWNVHGGVDVLMLGDTTKAFNKDKASKVVALVGLGLSY